MATLPDVKLQIAGIGHVYTAPVDTAPIDRTQFGVDYGVQFGMPKNVRIVAQIEAVKQ